MPSPAALVKWVRDQGIVAKASRLAWPQLLRLSPGTSQTAPLVLLFIDGSAGVLVGSDTSRNIVWIRDPRSTGHDAVAVDRLRLSQLWAGDAILMRRPRGQSDADRPFSLLWLMGLVLHQRRLIRDVSLASMVLSVLTIIPPLLIMSVIDRVVSHRSMSTLVLLCIILGVSALYETVIGYAPARADPGDVHAGGHAAEPAYLRAAARVAAGLFRAHTPPARRRTA